MADLYMHVMLSEELMKASSIPINPGLVKMGAQGPDPYYFNWLSSFHTQSTQLADDMHDSKINHMLIAMLSYVKEHYSLELHSFFIGFLSHYALDTTIHPYIYYHSGNYQKDDPSTLTHRGLHVRFERRVDIHFIRHVKKQWAHQYPIHRLSFDYLVVPKVIRDFMGFIAKTVYNVDKGDLYYAKGYVHLQRICKNITQDRYGVKKRILSLVDCFNKNQTVFYQDLSYHNYDEDFDYLNLKHQLWYHPVTGEPFTWSVTDLFDLALQRAKELMEETSKYLLHNQAIQPQNLFRNQSFNSGVDCNLLLKMQYFHLFQ